MNNQTYTTSELASVIGVHPNTIRFYEEIEFVTKAERLKNGYRVFTPLQLEQCRLVRLAMRAEILQHGLRDKAIEIVRNCARLDFAAAYKAADEYTAMLKNEISRAYSAIEYVEHRLKRIPDSNALPLGRAEAAKLLSVTTETIRTWERSGLLGIERGKNGRRVYNAEMIERLNIIRTLRLANYSLSAILRLMNKLDGDKKESLENLLNTPGENEDIVSVCDRLIVSLKAAVEDSYVIEEAIKRIEKIQPSSNTPASDSVLE